MNIIEKDAEQFYQYDFLNNGKFNDLSNLKSTISSKLYDFNRDRDKLDFLKTIRVITKRDIEEHMKTCSNSGCGYDKEREIGIFVIDQEIDDINEYYSFEPKKKDSFTPEQESVLHDKLNNILDKLERQGFGQEIIFNEIEELKNHFNLGKKNWFQLFKGKLIDLTLEKVLDESIVREIYNSLSDGFEQVIQMIE